MRERVIMRVNLWEKETKTDWKRKIDWKRKSERRDEYTWDIQNFSKKWSENMKDTSAVVHRTTSDGKTKLDFQASDMFIPDKRIQKIEEMSRPDKNDV